MNSEFTGHLDSCNIMILYVKILFKKQTKYYLLNPVRRDSEQKKI